MTLHNKGDAEALEKCHWPRGCAHKPCRHHRHLFFSNACASNLSLSCMTGSCMIISLEIKMLPSFSRFRSDPSCLFRNFLTRSCKKPNKQLRN
jgi:hypothetical protein